MTGALVCLWVVYIGALEHTELRGRHLGAFQEELYRGVECEVRVGGILSDPFEVTTGRAWDKGVYFHRRSSYCILMVW